MAQRTCIIDTSIIVKWYTNEEDSEKALELLDYIHKNEITIFVPDLVVYELTNSLRWNPNFTDADVQEALKSFLGLGFQIQVPTHKMLHNAIHLAYEYKRTVYDAVFLALAKEQNTFIITADKKFAKILKTNL